MTLQQNRNGIRGPHQGQPLREAGAPLAQAQAVMLMLHGRGADAQDILLLAPEFKQSHFAYLALQAARNSWYPYGLLAPLEHNEPGITSGLRAIADALADLEAEGFPPQEVILFGFSQGACLVLEFVARHARRYGGVVGLSGGLLGSNEAAYEYTGSLAGTPIFLGCSDGDFHVPLERLGRTASTLRKLGGKVTQRLYPGLGHVVNQSEIEFVRRMMANLLKQHTNAKD
jgi:predicted esterase